MQHLILPQTLFTGATHTLFEHTMSLHGGTPISGEWSSSPIFQPPGWMFAFESMRDKALHTQIGVTWHAITLSVQMERIIFWPVRWHHLAPQGAQVLSTTTFNQAARAGWFAPSPYTPTPTAHQEIAARALGGAKSREFPYEASRKICG